MISQTINNKQKTLNIKKVFPVSSFQFPVSRKGFTLLEFLVVIGLLSITIGSILLFLTAVLKGTNQANITSEVKQNGQVVLDTLESQIRNASDADCVLKNGSDECIYVKLFRPNTDPLHIRCASAVGQTESGRIEIASSALDDPTNFTSITNTDTKSGVSVSNCKFNVVPSFGGVSAPPIVAVSFTVSQGVAAVSRSDFVASVDFQTTISLRGY
ncbi:type II secretion system protein [Candidatus Microgenomates bacterium]|nr:type II secretion system protein [Candidatus Microgenomates bacterium]